MMTIACTLQNNRNVVEKNGQYIHSWKVLPITISSSVLPSIIHNTIFHPRYTCWGKKTLQIVIIIFLQLLWNGWKSITLDHSNMFKVILFSKELCGSEQIWTIWLLGYGKGEWSWMKTTTSLSQNSCALIKLYNSRFHCVHRRPLHSDEQSFKPTWHKVSAPCRDNIVLNS